MNWFNPRNSYNDDKIENRNDNHFLFLMSNKKTEKKYAQS